MRKVIICCTVLLMLSCKKEKTFNIPDGTYQGTFERQTPAGSGEISNVSITFSSGKWSGQSQYPKYPALCRGTYTDSKDAVTFTNECAWTADFDATLVLGNDYSMTINGTSLKMTQNLITGDKNVYDLVRQ
jgi:hypothetical protein